ncbi:MAG: hypothetical protein IJZ07_08360 [Clostridia bacterium]|nr:hypothetical protein [Clostridia bacterium]
MKTLEDAITIAVVGVIWAAISIFSKMWFMLIFTIIPIVCTGFEIYDYRLSRKAYKKFLEEERAKLGLTDTPIETEEPEFIEEDDDEEYKEYLEYVEKIEELQDFDNDSGKGYCPHCGNYAVNSKKTCESCGEKVLD